ncbi:hypothetical protein CBER1_09770 [Cercospora berteroae]|uniref:Uncharacterized protein n=1 Tax=Cercospora berteroae TaxID=357750 RepID=A0A2S6BWI3_9PEZI|nr:hypothetical protein CBER1_09770 [Cercospora berteroae]
MRVNLDRSTGRYVSFPSSASENQAGAAAAGSTEYEASHQRYRDVVKKAGTPQEIDFAKNRFEYEINTPVPYPYRSWTAFRNNNVSFGAMTWQGAMYNERQNPAPLPQSQPTGVQPTRVQTTGSMRQNEAATEAEINEAIGTDDEEDGAYEADEDETDREIARTDSRLNMRTARPKNSRSRFATASKRLPSQGQAPQGIRKQTTPRRAPRSRTTTPSLAGSPARGPRGGYTRPTPPTSPPANATFTAGTEPIPATVLRSVNEIKAVPPHNSYPSIKPLGKVPMLDGRYGYIERGSELMEFYGDTRLFTEKWWKFLSVGGQGRKDLVKQMGLGDVQP